MNQLADVQRRITASRAYAFATATINGLGIGLGAARHALRIAAAAGIGILAIGVAYQMMDAKAAAIIAAGGCVWLYARRKPKARPLDSHGTARFALHEHVEGTVGSEALASDPAALLIGRSEGKARTLLRYNGAAHLTTLMPTRAGKGTGSILPNLLTAARRAAIVVDPKGENAKVAARTRRTFGPVHILDPFGVSGQPSASYDPMSSLHHASPDLADDAATLADALVFDPPGHAGDPHWNESAKSLVSGLLMHIACRRGNEPGGLPELRRLLTLPAAKWFELLEAVEKDTEAAGGLVSRAASQHLGKPDREAASVLSSAQRHTAFLDSARIAAVSARSDFRFADLRTGTATVFLVLPPDRLSTYARWLRLLIAQAVQELARAPQLPGQPPVLLLLDEMAALGHLEPIKSAYGLMAGLGVQVWGIWQDLSQLRVVYGQDAPSFLANSGVIQVSAPADLETAKWLSATLGNATVGFQTTNTGTSTPGFSFGQGGAGSTSRSTSNNLTGRPLAAPDELMRMHSTRQILLRPGEQPALVTKLRHHADAEFAGLFD